MESEIVFIDFDGVLANTFQLAYNMHKILRPELTPESFRQLFENPSQTIPALNNPEDVARYNHAYQLKIGSQNIAFRGHETIARLSGIFTINICSTAPTPATNAFFEHHDLQNFISQVITGNSSLQITSAINQYLVDNNLEKTDIVLLTDTLGDLKAARGADIPAIAAAWGYHNEATLKQETGASILDQIDHLPGALEEHFDFSSEYQFS